MAGRRVFWACAFALLSACQSDAGEICERLDECGLLPKGGATKADPDGFTQDDCESQVTQEVPEARREHCANCVSDHACETIKSVCFADCHPE